MNLNDAFPNAKSGPTRRNNESSPGKSLEFMDKQFVEQGLKVSAMNKSLKTCPVWLLVYLFVIHSAVAADPIREQLEQAKVKFHSDQEEYRTAVTRFLEKREEAARKTGNKTLVDHFKSKRQAFDENGKTPDSLPTSIRSQQARALATLETAYRTAIKEYTKAGQDEQANAAEREWKATLSGIFLPADATKFDGKLYKIFSERLTWSAARRKCESMGGQLAVIKSKEQDRFLLQLAQKCDVDEVYLGATDEVSEGAWLWVTGEKMTYQNWGPLQPTNSRGIEHYMALRIRHRNKDYIGKWNDLPDRIPDLKVGYICQWD